MYYLKRRIAIAMTFLIAFQALLFPGESGLAAGEAESAVETEDGGSSDAEAAAVVTDEEKDDPLYARYHSGSGMSLMSGSNYTIAQAKKNLTHQSVFKNKYSKYYGIDVSKWQGEIDWTKVKKAGVDFAIIRLGYRGTSTGTINLDPYFDQNIKAAYEAGIDVGVYFFTQSITTSEAEKEAEFCLEHLQPYKKYLSYPVFIDIEPYDGGSSRLEKANLSKEKKTAICAEFCKTVDLAGFNGGIYCSKYYLTAWLNIDQLENSYQIWLAHYTDSTDYSRRYDMWQYSSSGSVNGISGAVDMDVSYILKVPAMPESFEQTEIEADSLTLSWDSVKYADGYRVYQYNSEGEREKYYTASSNSLHLTGLEQGKVYRFKVRSYYKDTNGTKKFSQYTTMLYAYTTPKQVSGVSLEKRGDHSLTLKWNALSSVDRYRVRFYDEESNSFTTVLTTKENSCTLDHLARMSGYKIVVQAYVKMNGETKVYGKRSNIQSFWTGTSQVEGVAFSKLTANSLKLTWTEQTGVGGYQVAWYDEEGNKLGSLVTEKTNATVSALSKGTLHYFKVRSFYKNGEKTRVYGSFSKKLTVITRPGQVTKLKQKEVQTTQLTLAWSARKGASGYAVYQYDTASKTYKRIKTTTACSYTVSNLSAARKYRFMVRAYTLNGDKKYYGEYSDVFTAVTSPEAVKSLSQTGRTKSSVTVSWKAVKRATGYQVRLYRNNKLVDAYDTANTSYKLKDLSGSYVVKVRAYAASVSASANGELQSLAVSTK